VGTSANTLELGADTTVCPGNSVLLNAKKGYISYLWQDGSTDSTFTVTQPGEYYVTVSDACSKSYTDTIQVYSRPPIPFDVSADRSKCNSDTLQFTAPAGFLNYSWSPAYNISSTSLQGVVVNPSVDTTYFVRAEKSPGCFAYDTIRVHVYNSPFINLGSDQSFCSGDSMTLDAGAGFSSYSWNAVIGSQLKTIFTTGSYTVIGTTLEGCRSSDTMQVVNTWTLPRVALTKSRVVLGTTRTFIVGNFSSYLWQDGSTLPTFTLNSLGSYWVRVTDNHNCKASDTAEVKTILPQPTRFLPDDTSICSYGTLVLRPSQSYSAYKWSTGSLSSAITLDKAGLYWLQVQDQKGCIGEIRS
jgi:hypothetical protein